VLPPEIAELSFAGAHCNALIYEFAADGSGVHLIDGSLTGKQHLEKAGILSLLGKVD